MIERYWFHGQFFWWHYLFQVSAAGYDRQGVADHANNLASKIRSNLTNSMKALGVDILTGFGTIVVSDILCYDL